MNIHALNGIRTRVSSNQAAADLGHKPQDERDQLVFHAFDKILPGHYVQTLYLCDRRGRQDLL
jgi:hypothetical protein